MKAKFIGKNGKSLNYLFLIFEKNESLKMLIKTQVTELIQKLPQEFDLEEIVDKLILLNKVQQGIDDANNGRVFTEDEVKKKLEKWLN